MKYDNVRVEGPALARIGLAQLGPGVSQGSRISHAPRTQFHHFLADEVHEVASV